MRAALAGDLCCDLSHLGLIAVRGPDTDPFLQGQLTCDIRQVTLDHSLIGAYCSPKGRALACFRLFRRTDACYLELPRPLVEPTLGRLCKYLLRAKTALEDASDTLARIGVAGPNAAALARNRRSAGYRRARTESFTADAIDSAGRHRDSPAWLDPALRTARRGTGTAARSGTPWRPTVTPIGAAPWRLLDILAGTPTVQPETVEAFVPQMLNLQLLDGISFQKGCYTGQEVVARTHYLGKLKRRMYLARVDGPAPPRPGDPLFSPQTDASQSAGRLADACRHPEGGYAVLAVALIECAEHGTLQLGDAGGPELRLEPLPYGFEAAG
ncbi:MAG: folate-binding protein [Chromatiales bacterium]|nr:folate-binding protein [Chromatiales bacterium]